MSANEMCRIERKLDEALKILKQDKDKQREIASLLQSILQPENWHGNTWFAKRSLVQWAEDIVSDKPIKRGGPVE